MRLNWEGHSVAVDVRGQGEPLVFIHGFPLDGRMWNRQVSELEADYQTIVVDLPGFGASEPAADTMEMEAFADVIDAVLDQLEVRTPVTLCGLSMGGYVAFAFYRKYAERVGRMILCDTKAVADTEEKQRERQEMAEKVLDQGLAFLAASMIPNLVAPGAAADVVSEAEEMAQRASPRGVAGALRGMASREDSTELLSRIAVPTLVICGEADTVSPVNEMRGIAGAISGARFEEIPSAGHLAPMENPEVVNRVIREFLAG